MKKIVVIILGCVVGVILLVAVAGFIRFNFTDGGDIVPPVDTIPYVVHLDVKNMAYDIEGDVFTLKNGVAEKEAAPGSATKDTLTIFGEPVYGDLDADGDTDAALLLVNDSGGTGKFYYAVLAMNTGTVYKPTNAMFLGDRIAPQNVTIQAGRAVYAFAERKADDPMTAEPSVGKTVWVHFDKNTGEIGEWVKDFEGEADVNKMSLDMKTWNWVSSTFADGTKMTPKGTKKFTLTFKKDGSFASATDCNGIGGNYVVKNKKITFSNMLSTMMYCEGSQQTDFQKILDETDNYYFTSKGELILGFKMAGGIAVFK